MKKILLVFCLVAFSCQKGPSIKEFNKLKIDLENCSNENVELKNTPEQRLLKAQSYVSANNMDQAKKEFLKIIEKYPQSPQGVLSKTFVDQIDYEEKQKQEKEDRIKNLGFKTLEETTNIKQDFVALKINNIKISKRWIFDRYDTRYFYRDAERDRKYLTADVNITSVVKEPNLPPFYLYQLKDGNLEFVTTINYAFYKWRDYGSYLGNHADYGNDFAHTETIKFTIGGVFDEYLVNDYPLFLLVKKENCVPRHYEKFNNPPVVYLTGECETDKILNVEKALKDFFTVKIFNKSKI